MDAIRIDRLTKSYGKKRGVVELSLRVDEGDFFGFIGPNGAGKSTTIRTLMGLIKPTSGSASVLGFDVASDANRLLAEVGYLPSEVTLYSGMKVRDVLKMSADMRRVDCADEARRLCDRLQLDTTHKVDELSFGNRKKVAIVCALQHHPRLLMLDEPTSGLDPLIQREFFEILKERNEAGATVFLSSHVLSEVQRNCRSAAIIREGRIVAVGGVEELVRANARRVFVRGAADVSHLAGVRDMQVTEEGMAFLYDGEMGMLLAALAAGSVEDLMVSEPNLEEVFLHYYQDGEGGR